MSIKDMFLKAAGFRLIEQEPHDFSPYWKISWRIKVKGYDYGSYCCLSEEEDIPEAREILKEQAWDTIQALINCHANA